MTTDTDKTSHPALCVLILAACNPWGSDLTEGPVTGSSTANEGEDDPDSTETPTSNTSVDPTASSSSTASTEPTPECGNGVVEGDEECDDGNLIDVGPGDLCKNNCTASSCQAPEQYGVCDHDLDPTLKEPSYLLRALGFCGPHELQFNYPVGPIKEQSWQVARGFGTFMHDHDLDPETPDERFYSPREGDFFLMLSTGLIELPDNSGVVIEAEHSQVTWESNGNPAFADVLPAPFKHEHGSNNGAGGTPFKNCDNGVINGDNDCSDTLQVQWQQARPALDSVYFTFDAEVPPATFGYTFDFVYCSSEWPEYVHSVFNDMLFVYQVDPTLDNPDAAPPIDPYSGSVTYLAPSASRPEALPLTITTLDTYLIDFGSIGDSQQLDGTGFEGNACTGWLTARGSVQPGAHITLGFFLADTSDGNLSTVVLLDNFRWNCQGCAHGEIDEGCGVHLPSGVANRR